MPTYRVSPNALIDIEGFRQYLIRKNGEQVADEFLESIYQKFSYLTQFPNVARKRIDIAEDAYSYPLVRYKRIILFRKISGDILVVRVLGGRQEPNRHIGGEF